MKLERLTPAFKDYLWGGTKLREVYHKPCDFDKVAESWELSTHPAGESRILGGGYDGLTLSQYFQQVPQALGTSAGAFEDFPVLIKLIDAKDPLSIQVHPSDEYARRVEGEYGKTEMWYIVDCDPGAFLYFGVNRPVTKEEFHRRIQENTILEVLKKVEVHPGDVFFIQSGTIHAIGAGILICEIQQNSNCTYRVYDYDRRGADGKPRELHLEKALDVCRLTPSDTDSREGLVMAPAGGTVQRLGECRYFSTEKLQVEEAMTLWAGKESFVSLLCVEGAVLVSGPENRLIMNPGDSVLIPAGTGSVGIQGQGAVIKTVVPDLEERFAAEKTGPREETV